MARNLRDGARHLDPGCAGADNDEGQQPPPLGLVLGELGLLECQEDAAADAGRVLDALQSRRDRGPFVMSEIGVRRPGRDHERVVGDRTGSDQDAPPRDVDAGHLGHQNGCVLLLAQNVPDRPGDVGRRQRGGRHLIEQRLEAMMVLPVDQRDVDGRAGERFRGFQTAEAGADNDDFGPLGHGKVPVLVPRS